MRHKERMKNALNVMLFISILLDITEIKVS